jgi:glycosyltransferase involved in cell wall biosynthesis
MIRILLIHPRPTRGGFTALVSEAAELCRRTGYEVVVGCAFGPRLDELPPASSVEVLHYPLTSLRGVWELRGIVARIRPNVIHFHGRQAGFIGRLTLPAHSRGHVLYTPHGTPWVGQSFGRSVAGDLAERLLLRRTAAVLCVSHHEVEEWSRRDATQRIRYLPNTVSLLPRGHKSHPEGRGVADRSRTMLVPSGYNPQKRIEVVIEALALLRDPRPSVAIVGAVDRSDYRDHLVGLAARLGVTREVHFGEDIANIRAALREASLVILPSFSEGLPIVGQEAIAEGARVAWSRISAHVELFGDAGAPFWTAAELAAVMVGDHNEASVATRQTWLCEYQRSVEKLRAEFWDELEGIIHNGRH